MDYGCRWVLATSDCDSYSRCCGLESFVRRSVEVRPTLSHFNDADPSLSQLHDIMTTHLTSRGSSSTPANNTGIGVGATEAIGVDGTGIGFGGGGLAWLAYGSRGFGNPTHLPATSTKL